MSGLKKIRDELGMTQINMARALGVSIAAVQKLEQGCYGSNGYKVIQALHMRFKIPLTECRRVLFGNVTLREVRTWLGMEEPTTVSED